MTKLQYILTCLQEESSELSMAASKCIRFGMKDHHPKRTSPNDIELVTEFSDVLGVMLILFEEIGGDWEELLNRGIDNKVEKLEKYIFKAKIDGVIREPIYTYLLKEPVEKRNNIFELVLDRDFHKKGDVSICHGFKLLSEPLPVEGPGFLYNAKILDNEAPFPRIGDRLFKIN